MTEINCLNDIEPGQTAKVRELLSTGSIRRRLLDIGLIENTEVECLGRSPAGDPSAFLIRGAVIAIRKLCIRDSFSALICWFVGRPLLKFVSAPEQFRSWVDGHGIYGRLAFIGMMVLQVFIAIIPGEPLESGSGYAFGMWEGTLLCMAGAVSYTHLDVYKRQGMRSRFLNATKRFWNS